MILNWINFDLKKSVLKNIDDKQHHRSAAQLAAFIHADSTDFCNKPVSTCTA